MRLLSLAAVAFLAAWSTAQEDMVYGPCLTTTLEANGLAGTTTKAMVVRCGDGAVAFDTELLRVTAAWTGGWLELRGTAYDGSHGPMPALRGAKLMETRPLPGWAHAGELGDPRAIPYGPLPREHGQYRGYSLVGDGAVIAYRIGDMEVRESFEMLSDARALVRALELGPSAREQVLVVADGPDGASAIDGPSSTGCILQWPGAEGQPPQRLAAGFRGAEGPTLAARGARILLTVPPHQKELRLRILVASGTEAELTGIEKSAAASALKRSIRSDGASALQDTPPERRWGEPIVTKGTLGKDDGPFAVDTITIPFENPFHSRMRTAAFDLFADGRAAVSTWNGDVWIVRGIDQDLDRLEWSRFATGLFDPLGLRIVDDVVYVHGRDGITILRDRDGNGEADQFECLTNAIYATPAFHEFAFDLQTDAEGNFYVSKGAPVNPGGRGFMTIVPHHGTILKIQKDGSSVSTIATGLRAPNGIGVGPNGVVTSGDNEGTFMPRCRLNWIDKPGFYAGVKPTAHRDAVPEQPDLPLCWFPMEVDNSSGGQVWVPGSTWGELGGRLLHLSYGTCSTYLVLQEEVDGVMQGGVVRLPANFSSSCMRGRFSAGGDLFVIGLQGWQTSAARDGGFHRVRRTKAPLGLPLSLQTSERGVVLTFAEPLDPATAADPESYGVQVWNYLYSPNYGSPELSLQQPDRKVEQGKPNRDSLQVTAASLSADRRTVSLAITGLQPVHQMKITWDVDAADGRALKGELHSTIHRLGKAPGASAEGGR